MGCAATKPGFGISHNAGELSEAERAKAEHLVDEMAELGGLGPKTLSPARVEMKLHSGGARLEEPHCGGPSFSLAGLQRALRGALGLERNQLISLGEWWYAAGLDGRLRGGSHLELSLEGDGHALELAVIVPQSEALESIPSLLTVLRRAAAASGSATPVSSTAASSSDSGPPSARRPSDSLSMNIHADPSFTAEGLRWQAVLEQMATSLADPDVGLSVIWLRLAGLGLPAGISRQLDLGIRLLADPRHGGISIMNAELLRPPGAVAPSSAIMDSLEACGVNEEDGWAVYELGSSLSPYGPKLLLGAAAPALPSATVLENDHLLERTIPRLLCSAVRRLVSGAGVHMVVRAALKDDGRVSTSLRLDFPGGADPSLGIDLAVGRNRAFDPLLVERVVQLLHGIGASAVVSAIECRPEGPALVALLVRPSSDIRNDSGPSCCVTPM